jgi:hypothetical protein
MFNQPKSIRNSIATNNIRMNWGWRRGSGTKISLQIKKEEEKEQIRIAHKHDRILPQKTVILVSHELYTSKKSYFNFNI